MLVERSELTVKDGVESKFPGGAFQKIAPLLQSVEGVLSIQLGKGIGNPTKFLLLVGWASLDMHKAYGETPKSLEVRQIMGPFITGGAMEHLELT